MKKVILSLFVAAFILSGCNKTKQFNVALNLDNADQQTVYLFKTVENKVVCIDSAVFAGKTAELKADFDDPQIAYSIKFDKGSDCGNFTFFTENQNTVITGDRNEMQRWVAKGCPTMDEYNSYRDSFLPMEDELMVLFNEANDVAMAGDTVKGAEIIGQVYAMIEEYNNQRIDYFRNHGDSYLTHFFVNQAKEEMGLEVVKELASHFTTESLYSKQINEYIAECEKAEGDTIY